MAHIDQRARWRAFAGKPFDDRVDRRNIRAMKKIIDRYGWPGKTLVDDAGAQAAWLLVQHADQDRAFQKKCQSLLEAAVKANDAPAQHLAYLTDRICVGDGVPQIYGTQLEYPIADQEHVDERRSAAGLDSLAEYLASTRQILEQMKKRTGR